MRAATAIIGAALAAAPAVAQQPTFSPDIERVIERDTSLTIWLFVSPNGTLNEASQLVTRLGGTVRHVSRWLNAVSAELTTAALRSLRTRDDIRHVQPVARFRGKPETLTAESPRRQPIYQPLARDTLFGPSEFLIRVLNLFGLVNRGFRGSGVRIAILDTGFETQLPAFQSALVIAQRDFVFNDSVVRNEPNDVAAASAHGTTTWSLLAAQSPGNLVGVAPAAEYILAKTEDVRSETRVEEDHLVAAMEWADSLGTDIITVSLGYLSFDDGFSYVPEDLNGDVAVTSIAADIAAGRGITVVVAAGNDGPLSRSLLTPADADSVITVGAVDSLGAVASFSSRGPTADGRIKPELMAPGVAVPVLAPTGFSRSDGTSYSAPLVAGTVALLKEVHPTLSANAIREALLNSGSNRETPDTIQGWGIPNGLHAATFPLGITITSPVGNLLTSVTPIFSWAVPNAPEFARPYSFRLRVGRDTTLGELLLDTITTAQSVAIAAPQAPGSTIGFQLTAISADSEMLTVPATQEFTVPQWVDLLTFDTPAGGTTRETRPVLSWTSPVVISPPGPFVYDVEVLRVPEEIVEVRRSGLTTTSFVTDRDLEFNTPYSWRVTARLGSDSSTVASAGVFVVISDAAPPTTLLYQNFPNPFPNPAAGTQNTCIWFDLAVSGSVRLDILDLRGHLVRNLPIPGGILGVLRPGRYGRASDGDSGLCDPSLEWDGSAEDGTVVPQGIYLAKLQTPEGVFFKRIVFLGRGF